MDMGPKLVDPLVDPIRTATLVILMIAVAKLMRGCG